MEAVRRAVAHRAAGLTAVAGDDPSRAFTYGDVLVASSAVMLAARSRGVPWDDATARAAALAASREAVGSSEARFPLRGPRVAWTIAVMAPPGPEYVAAMFAVWRMGAVAVPLSPSHPAPELQHALLESNADCVLAVSRFVELARPLKTNTGEVIVIDPVRPGCDAAPRDAPFDLAAIDASAIERASGSSSCDETDEREDAPRSAEPSEPAAPTRPKGGKNGKKRKTVSLNALCEEAPARKPARKPALRSFASGAAISSSPGDAALMATPSVADSDGALIIFTSGTTGKPKAALHTHASLAAQCAALCEAWAWTAKDRIYHCLPLHHVHGIVNAWLCAAVAGATCEFHDAFSPTALWSRFESDPAVEPPITIFMGVPTMYHRMVQAWDQRRKMESGGVNETLISARSWSQACAKSLRLAVSGSAALSAAVAKRWREVSAPGMITTGVIPLERYGMTEIGMALSNPLEPAAERELSRVGAPLPGVDVRVAEERELEEEKQAEKEETVKALKNAARGSGSLPARGKKRDAGKGKEEGVSAAGGAGGAGAAGAATGAAGAAKWSLDPTPRLPDTLSLRLETSGASAKEVVIARGELRVRGPGVFARYVNRPEATARCFDKLGYFKTGDVVEASRSGVGPAPDRVTYRVLGRMSADIIKRGGYKLSALEIEEALMEINGVGEAAVLGLPDEAYGETLAAVMTLTQPTLLFEPGYYDSRETMSKTARAIVKAAQKLAEYKIPALWRVVPRIPRNAMGKVNKRKLASLFDAAFDGFEFTPVKERAQGEKLYEFANDADPGVMKLSKQQGYKYFHRMPWGHRANDGGTDLLRLECDRCRSGKDPRTRIRETYYISKDGWCEKETQIEPR